MRTATLSLQTESYVYQSKLWPKEGQHILAHFGTETIIVYQAYRPSIANYAVQHGKLGGSEFSRDRMSWIKPNFLWMMYRSGWATKPDQQAILGLRIRRAFFDQLLANAVASSFSPALHTDRPTWEKQVGNSEVRLQWDPDHNPSGGKENRRAVQLGLHGSTLDSFADGELLEVIDMSEFVAAQRSRATAPYLGLITPIEQIYLPALPAAAKKVGLTPCPD